MIQFFKNLFHAKIESFFHTNMCIARFFMSARGNVLKTHFKYFVFANIKIYEFFKTVY